MNRSDLLRYARTLSHLHPVQIAFRPVHMARAAALSRSQLLASLVAGSGPVDLTGPVLGLRTLLAPPLPGMAPELARARTALVGSVRLVGQSIELAPPATDFAPPAASRLVRYQLAYLGVVRSLAIAARTDGFDSRAGSLAVALLREFLDRVPPGTGDAWDPYPVAMRIINVVIARELLSQIAPPEDAEFLRTTVPAAIAQHARWLAATLELHLLGNHLFTDGAALFVAGCVIDAPQATVWRTIGRRVIRRSIETDVLPDGGHAERSPMYAAVYLDQLELVLAAALARRVSAPMGALAAAQAMSRQLLQTAHPDGDIPLFGDSALDEAPLPADLAGPLGLAPESLRTRLYGVLRPMSIESAPIARTFPATGTYAIRTGDEMLIVDAGTLGARDQPGHAHSDALTFELSHCGRRLITDAGAGHYEADGMRGYFRGPLAHSSVSVDGKGPDEVWSAFRAARRGDVAPMALVELNGWHVLRGSVVAAWGWEHERLIFYVPGHLLCVFDVVRRAPKDARVESHIHFGPDVAIELESDGGEIGQAGQRARLVRLVGSGWSLHQGESDPWRGLSATRLGEIEPSPEVAVVATNGSPRFAGYALLLSAAAEASPTDRGADIRHDNRIVRVHADTRGLRWESTALTGQ